MFKEIIKLTLAVVVGFWVAFYTYSNTILKVTEYNKGYHEGYVYGYKKAQIDALFEE